MNELIRKIDIYAMRCPKNFNDVLEMLHEIRSELRNINNHIDAAAKACENKS